VHITRPFSGTVRMAVPVLARKAKEAEIVAKKKTLEEAGPDHPVLKRLADAKADAEPPTAIYKALKKPRGTLTLIAEYRKKVKSGFIKEMMEPVLMSPVYRNSGAKVVSVYTNYNVGGCTVEDAKVIADEQYSAMGQIPGPMPVMIHDIILDPIQLAEASLAGVSGVTLSAACLGRQGLGDMMQAATSLGLEAMVQVSNEEEMADALAVEASLIAVQAGSVERFLELGQPVLDMEGGEKTVESILAQMEKTAEDKKTPVLIAAMERRSDEGLEEVEDAWVLRSKGFNAVYVGDIIYKGGMEQQENTRAIIKSFLAKTSVSFGRARAKSGRGEGAKEYLGTILM